MWSVHLLEVFFPLTPWRCAPRLCFRSRKHAEACAPRGRRIGGGPRSWPPLIPRSGGMAVEATLVRAGAVFCRSRLSAARCGSAGAPHGRRATVVASAHPAQWRDGGRGDVGAGRAGFVFAHASTLKRALRGGRRMGGGPRSWPPLIPRSGGMAVEAAPVRAAGGLSVAYRGASACASGAARRKAGSSAQASSIRRRVG